MSITLDLRTLSLTTMLFTFIFGMGLIFYAAKNRKFSGISTIGYGFLAIGIGYILLGLRQIISDFSSIVVANSVIYFGVALMYKGLFRFIGIKISWEKYVSSFFLISLIFYLYFYTYHEPNVNIRILAFSACFSVLCYTASYGLFKSRKQLSRHAIILLATMFLIVGIFHSFRVAWTLNEVQLSNFMEAGMIHALTIINSQFMVLFTTFAVIWIASDSLENELKKIAMTDPLTLVYNRRAFGEFCDKEFSRSSRNGKPISIILCDIDYFKKINDVHGHQLGDRVLVDFAMTLKKNIRKQDIVARYGGEEFLILLPETPCQQAAGVAEKLRRLVMEHKLVISNSNILSVTASFGVASSHDKIKSWSLIIKAADTALYKAKNNGRNCVAVSDIAV